MPAPRLSSDPARSGRGLLGWLVAAVLAIGAAPAFADIYVYYNVFGHSFRLGTVPTTTGYVGTTDGAEHHTDESRIFDEESHLAIVCESGRCGVVDDCKSCHVTPKRATTFDRRVARQHRLTHFPRATLTVGPSPVPFDGGFVRQEAGRLVLLDRDRSPRYRLPAGARLLKDTRTGQPLFIVYDGRTPPEAIRR